MCRRRSRELWRIPRRPARRADWNFIFDCIPPPHVLLPRQRDSHLLGHRAGLGHHQVGDVALLPPAGLDEEQLGSPVQLADVTHLRWDEGRENISTLGSFIKKENISNVLSLNYDRWKCNQRIN